MRTEAVLTATAALALSIVLTWAMRKFALARGVLDVPNQRSSHTVPTPRGGGIAIVLAATTGFVILAVVGTLQIDLLVALIGGGIAVAVVGFLDDRQQLSAGIRLAVHLGAALWALAWLGGLPEVRIANHVVAFGWWGYALGVLGIVWTLNLFNFMDGIDGIAASEAIFVSWAGAVLALASGTSSAVSAPAFVFGAACCGFLLWNWPPAKIFMGDAGSGYLGYVIAVLAVAASRDNGVALLVWLILGGTFFVDATVTLARRLNRGERAYEAHRSHAYQWLARRWGSHVRVTVTNIAVSLVWLFPCALLATLYPQAAGWILCVALIPVAIAAIAAGAGRLEVKPSKSHSRERR